MEKKSEKAKYLPKSERRSIGVTKETALKFAAFCRERGYTTFIAADNALRDWMRREGK